MPPSTEVRPRPKHRTFTADQRLTILEEYEAATTPLERAGLCGTAVFTAHSFFTGESNVTEARLCEYEARSRAPRESRGGGE